MAGSKHMYRVLFNQFLVHAEETKSNTMSKENKGRVVVGGGSGFIGSELTKSLKRKGYDVTIVSRKKEPFNLTWDEVEQDGLPHGLIAVVNLTGHNVLDFWYRWTPTFKQLVYESRVKPAHIISTAIQRQPEHQRPKTFVQVTGVGFYPPEKETIFDESGHGGEHDFLARLVVDWENAARLPDECKGTRNVFVRPGAVLGRNGGLIQQVFLPFYFGTGGRMGSGDQPMPWIHVKDLSGMIIHIIENEQVKGVVNGVAPEIITNSEFVKAFASSLNRPAFFPIPEFAWNLIFGEERATIVTKGPKVVPKKALDTGFQFRFGTISKACQEFASLFYSDSDR